MRYEMGIFGNIKHGTSRVILDPEGETARTWNKVFLVTCLVTLFVDPLFFLLPHMDEAVVCIVDDNLKVKLFLTVMRSVADVLYAVQIYVKFHTAYAAPLSSTFVFGRGIEFNPLQIAVNYLKNGFFLDLVVALPVPQVMIWGLIPNLSGSKTSANYVFLFVMICQYLPRLFMIFPLSSKIVKSTGVVTQTAWAGAAYNLMLSILASHVLGASWFLQAIARQEQCWQYTCALEAQLCQYSFFDCSAVDDIFRKNWYKSSNISNICDPSKNEYPFGIFGEALTSKGLLTSTSIGEIVFAIVIAILGLVLFALLISNMQKYLRSTTMRLEEWSTKRSDTEQWMHHRQLPEELRQSVRRHEQYKWAATRGVDEEVLLNGLPLDLHRQIKRHLCLYLIRRVPLIDGMDEMIQDLIIERLKPALYTKGALLIREGRPLSEMIFIIQGHLNSVKTTAGQPGMFNSSFLRKGDFCGEELLYSSIDPRASLTLSKSSRTVQAVSKVEAFVITAQDLRDVGVQIRLHQDQFRHKCRFYSHQWRTWAACFIQGAWRRHWSRRSRK
ncbi:hypothetical protein KSS87_017287 [Heliosperma pusillum]|nr:hypothetical protein KSS87_017287 [Heliosperma pusillum]